MAQAMHAHIRASGSFVAHAQRYVPGEGMLRVTVCGGGAGGLTVLGSAAAIRNLPGQGAVIDRIVAGIEEHAHAAHVVCGG